MNCYYCGKDLLFVSEYYMVRRAIKPKGFPYRWICIGYACSRCEETNTLSYKYNQEPPKPALYKG